ncbi:DUF488 family protein [Sulfolobus tengchongensis]|uniref:DUF488 family protein n=1 Tax=Sulfolobus tengchongensis TaxID=207809 RepID=A0AAX4KZH4_9CREN
MYTIGHSNRSLEDFLFLLKRYKIEVLIDVRRWPRSSKYPHFNRENLMIELEKEGVEYLWKEELGGYRKFRKDVEDRGIGKCFESEGFRAYATYILENDKAISALKEIEKINKVKAIMCAEKLPWNCHRKIISDWYLAKGYEVIHIIENENTIRHKLSKCAMIVDNRLYYK